MAAGETVHRGSWTRDDRAESIWHYLPVEVPAGAAGLEVTLDFDHSGGVLDLGCIAPSGWRGWSGGARSRFAITPGAATPGYLPGELEPGTWQVVLGLHRVAEHGTAYDVRARVGATEVEPDPPAPAVPVRPARRELPAPQGKQWLAGDLHAHTLHSDGKLSIEQLAAQAVEQGLDFLAVTDHNTTSHFAHLERVGAAYGIVLVPGQEVTTDVGHANAFGPIGWVDFRAPAQQWVDTVEAAGGLLSINHPLADDCCWRHPLVRRPPLAEVWHWSWTAYDLRWGGPTAWWQAFDRGEQVPTIPVGGSDFHDPAQGRLVGAPTTWVLAEEISVDGVLAGLRAGRTAITADRSAPALLRTGDELRALGGDGTLLVGPDGRRRAVHGDDTPFPGSIGPHRLESHDGGLVAISS